MRRSPEWHCVHLAVSGDESADEQRETDGHEVGEVIVC